MQRGHDSVGDDAGTEPTRCAPDDLTVEHQAHLTGPAEIEVLPDHLLEEDASRHRLIEHLGERKLGLQDGERIAIAGGTITRRKRMRQAAQPLAQQPIDPVGRKPIAQLLHQLGVGARFYAVVERLEFNSALGQLALEVFVAVDAEFGVVGKVGAELQEERSEVLVNAIEIVVVDHRGGFHDPRICCASDPAATALRPHDPRLFLGLADIDNALALAKAPQVSLRDIIFALSLLERNEINGFVVGELLDVANKRLAHRHDGGRGRKALAPVHSKISDHSPHGLQVWHVYVEVHPIDRLKLKHNMVTQYIRHRSCYAHSGLRSSTGLATHRASSSYIQGIVPAGSIGVHLSLAIAINAPSSAYTSSV